MAATAQRNKQVVAQKSRQANVPSAPEDANAVSLVRGKEIDWQTQAEHETEADRHIRVGGKIEVDLETIADPGHPAVDKTNCITRCRCLVNKVEIGHDRIDQHRFLEQAESKQRQTDGQIVGPQPPVLSCR